MRDQDRLWTNAKGERIGVIEWTTRTREGAFFMRPTRLSSEIVTGILYRARAMYEVEIYSYAFLSNHAGILMGSPTHEQASSAMCYINGQVAKELSTAQFANISGPFWHRRARAIPVITDYKLEERHRYHLSNGTKEHLVSRPHHWPGAHAARSLHSGRPDVGRWVRRGTLHALQHAEAEAQALNPTRRPRPFRDLLDEASEFYEFMPDVLPTERHLSSTEYRDYNRALMRDISADAEQARAARARERIEITRRLQKEDGRLVSPDDPRLPKPLRVLGKKKLQAIDPHARPASFRPTPAPHVHCDTREEYDEYRGAYHATVNAQAKWVTPPNRRLQRARASRVVPYNTTTIPVGVAPLPALRPAPSGEPRPP